MTGIGTLIALLPVIPIGWVTGLSAVPTHGIDAPGFARLLLWGTILGLLSSLASTWAWSIAARRLPVALAGQLIVSETVFALLYDAAYRGEAPSAVSLLGAALLLIGCCWRSGPLPASGK